MTLEQPSAAVGLDQAEVHARMQAGQVNTAPSAPGRTVGQILRANVLTRFNAILGAMFVVVVAVGPVQDAIRRGAGGQHRVRRGTAGRRAGGR
jgi:cation-transporting ATPase E